MTEAVLSEARILHDIRSGSRKDLLVANFVRFEKGRLVLISVFQRIKIGGRVACLPLDESGAVTIISGPVWAS